MRAWLSLLFTINIHQYSVSTKSHHIPTRGRKTAGAMMRGSGRGEGCSPQVARKWDAGVDGAAPHGASPSFSD